MAVDIKKFINDVLRIKDDYDAKCAELEEYKKASAYNKGVGELSLIDPMAGLTVVCMNAGRKIIFEKIFSNWSIKNVSIKLTDREDVNNIITFDEWKNKFDYEIYQTYSYGEDRVYLDMFKNFPFNQTVEFFNEEFKEIRVY